LIRARATLTVWTLIFVLVGAAWGGFLGSRHVAAIGSELDRLESVTLDWRYAISGARPPPRGVVIAAIDDATIARAGGFPLPRDALARIVLGLAAATPQAIALDILLIDPGPPEADQELAAALRSARSVIGAAAVFDSGLAGGKPGATLMGTEFMPRPAGIRWPARAFLDAARPGLTNVSTDWSGVPRYVPLVFDYGGSIVPSLALAAAAAALNTEPVFGTETVKLAGRSVSTDLGYHLPLRFYDGVRTFSAMRAMSGELDPDDVRGQIVVVGVTAIGAGDTFVTPFNRATPGVAVMATAISNLLAGDALVRDAATRWIDAAAAVALPVSAVLLLAIRRAKIALPLAAAAFGAWLVATFVAFTLGYWLSLAVPLAAAVPTALGYGMIRLALAQRAARMMTVEREALRRFQPPRLAELLARDADFLAVPVHQPAAIVFVDLSGFTGMTEALGPAWTRELLAQMHQLIETVTNRHGGFVVSYMGDGAMIVFGLPSARPDDASQAARAVVALHDSLVAWIATLPPVARDRLAPRVGGHFGPVILSRLGAADHQHIAATGDTVNVASRLLEVAKQHRAGMAVSDQLHRAAAEADGAGEADADTAIMVEIRGRARPMAIRLLESSNRALS
jgi:adenylate cyclase